MEEKKENKFVAWLKKHKNKLITIGVGVAGFVGGTVVGIAISNYEPTHSVDEVPEIPENNSEIQE